MIGEIAVCSQLRRPWGMVDYQGDQRRATVEDWMPGERPKALTSPLIAQLDGLMARMHQVSESAGLRFGHGTDLRLFGPDDDN